MMFSSATTLTRQATVGCLAVAAATLVLSAQAPSPLKFVSTAWPPFTNPPGQPRFALDLVEAGLRRIDVRSQTSMVAAGEYTRALLSGSYDGSAAAWRDADRERALVFSQPYLENRLVLVGRRGADVSAATLAALAGKRIAIVEGYSYGEAVDGSGPVFVRSQSEEDSLSQLLKDAVDYTLIDDLVVQYIVANYPDQAAAKLQIGATALVRRGLFLAVRRTRPDAESIIARFNAQLRGMIADRTYHRLLHVNWIRADVNGDGVPEYVPSDDHVGPLAPQRSYDLFATTETAPKATEKKSGFYVGGTLYSDWASVPESYKEVNQNPPDPRRSSASIFKFTW